MQNTKPQTRYPYLLDIVKAEFIYVGISLFITLAGIGLMMLMGPVWEMTILNVATILVALIIKPILILYLCYYFLCKKERKSLAQGFALALPSNKLIFSSIALAITCVVIPNLFAQIFPSMATAMGKDSSTLFSELLSNPLGLTLVCIAALMAPIYEEIFFRQFVYTKVAKQFNYIVAIVVVVFWFAAAHIIQYWGNFLAIGLIFLLSVILTLLRHYSKSLVPSMVMHMAYNGIVVFALLSGI